MEGLSVWNPLEVPAGSCVSWKLCGLSVWTERYEHEWHILARTETGGPAEEAARPEVRFCKKKDKPVSSEWKHYLVREGGWALPVPAPADRPIVLRPDRALILLPGEKARFFLALPIRFRLLAGKRPDAPGGKRLCEWPVLPMANAWFGDPVSGELCYFTEARLYHEHDQIPFSPYRAVCPLKISNESDRELPFDRFCLHTEFLGVYRGAERLWTNEVDVIFKGSDQASQILPSKSAPVFGGPAKLVAEPRHPIENWYFKRTFDLLKYVSGF